MNRRASRFDTAAGVALLLILICNPAWSQSQGATLAGKISGASGAGISNARISLKSAATGQSVEVRSDAAGSYRVPNLAPGEYEIVVSADGYIEKTARVTISPGASQTLDLSLNGTLSLGDLGFSPGAIQGNAREQARLDKRTHMLKIHQKLGLITAVPMIATVVSGSFAGGRSTSSSNRNLHATLGGVTAGMYYTTAAFAIFAPKIPGTRTYGNIRLHKTLAWVHGTGMILLPILGALAYQQRSHGERVHGIASAHGAVGYITAGAYVSALLSVSF